MKNIALNRQLLGVEDLLLGIGVLEQTRGGVKVNITKLNALNIPFDDVKTIADILNEKLDITSYTAQSILAKLLTIDGHTSGLDADLLDGHEGSWYQQLLESGVNIKTLNGLPILGSGDFQLTIGSGGYAANVYLTNLTSTTNASYKQLSYSPDVAEVILNGTANNNDVLIYSSIFDGDVKATGIPPGEWGFHFHRKVDNIAQLSRLRFDIYKRSSAGVETVLFSTYSNDINDTTYVREDLLITQPSYTVVYTDRIGLKVYASTTRTSNTIISFKIGDGEASFINTPLQLRHNQLRDRDEVDAHPISAITGLQTSLDSKVNLGSATSNTMTKAQFNALAEERKANRAGSGFDEWGKHHSTVATYSNINEGMWATTDPINSLYLGKETASSVGVSKSQYPIVNINGVIQKIKGSSIVGNTDSTLITLPTAPNIYPYDTVLTPEQIASGVIKHADASNSGLIVNGKFDTDTSGWTAMSSSLAVESSKLKITNTSTTNGVARQAFSSIIGKEYIIEFEATTGSYKLGMQIKGDSPYISGWSIGGVTTGRYTFKYTATTTTTYLFFAVYNVALEAYAYVDNIEVYPSDAISRSDLVFLESWHEDISEKNIVYPLGNVQYLGGNTDGLTGIANGAFSGFETYSLFGSWMTPSALIGKGYVWSSLTEAQKRAFVANPENNCYLDGDKVIQTRYRVRVVQGLGDSWVNVDPQATVNNSLFSYSSTGGNESLVCLVEAKGKLTNVLDMVSASSSIATYYGANHTSQLGSAGVYTAAKSSALVPAIAYEGKCYALPLALVHRKNQGMYHPVYNPNGTKKASDNKFWYETTVSFTSISDCFTPDKLLTASGYIGSVSGRPDGLFYDQVHEGDITDLRNSSKKSADKSRLISREFNKLVAGTYRGKGNEKLFKPITFTNCGFVQYGSPVEKKQPYRTSESSSFMPKWKSYWGSTGYGSIKNLFGGVIPTIPFAIILAKKDGTNYFIEVSPSFYEDLATFRTLDGTPTLPNVGSLVELVFDEITWLWLPRAYGYIGASYGHKNSIISTRTKSNTLLHCDIIGNPTNYPTAWKQSGIFGTPLIVAEDGTSLLPDGTKDTFKLSRKANATPLLCLRSTDSGVTWTSFTPTFSTTTNAITLTDEPAANLVMVYYQTHTSMAVPVVNSEVLEYGKVLGTNGLANAHLVSTLIGKVSTANTSPYLQMGYDINAYRIDTSTIKWSTTATEIPVHSALTLAGGASGIATVKVFPYLTILNGKAYLNLVFKEMKYNGTSWGDDSKFNIVDKVSTTTDLNAQTVLIGQKTVELPYFIGADE